MFSRTPAGLHAVSDDWRGGRLDRRAALRILTRTQHYPSSLVVKMLLLTKIIEGDASAVHCAAEVVAIAMVVA